MLSCWFLAQLIFSTLKMEAICSSETSVGTQRTTRRHIPEDDTLHNRRCGNLKSYVFCLLSGRRVPTFRMDVLPPISSFRAEDAGGMFFQCWYPPTRQHDIINPTPGMCSELSDISKNVGFVLWFRLPISMNAVSDSKTPALPHALTGHSSPLKPHTGGAEQYSPRERQLKMFSL
jgi:hypothetical protein